MFTYRTGAPEAEVSVYREDLWGVGGGEGSWEIADIPGGLQHVRG